MQKTRAVFNIMETATVSVGEVSQVAYQQTALYDINALCCPVEKIPAETCTHPDVDQQCLMEASIYYGSAWANQKKPKKTRQAS